MSILFRKNSKPRMAIDEVFRFITNNAKLLLGAYIVSWFLGGYLLAAIEGWRLLDGLYWANVASLTIGYGDFSPKTDLGKGVSMVLHVIWALYLVLCIAAHMVKFLFRDKNEMTHDEQEWLFDTIDDVKKMLLAQAKNDLILAEKFGVTLDMSAFLNDDGTFKECTPQPTDTSYGNIERANAKLASKN